MGCFCIQGGISQLPIFWGDRVAGIFCKIDSSLNYPTVHAGVGEYMLYPMCPIIYGEYNDYGSIENVDRTETVKLLEEFFQNDIETVLKDFSSISIFGCDDTSLEHLHNLIDMRDFSKPNWRRKENIDLDDNDIRKLFITNNFCLIIEHESIVKRIIKEFEIISKKEYQYYINKQPNWNKEYDKQLKLFKKHGLDVYNNSLDVYLRFDLKEMYKSNEVLFPIEELNYSMGRLFASDCMMDLFVNYPDMYPKLFDHNLKKDYLDTLKFYRGLDCMRMHMFINRDYGSQWQNTKGWRRLLKTYKEINDKRLKKEKEWEED